MEVSRAPLHFSYVVKPLLTSKSSRQQTQPTLQFQVPEFNSYSACTSAVNLAELGFNNITDGNLFLLEIDVHSLFSALVVAYEINGVWLL
jgi:hypothetical protein